MCYYFAYYMFTVGYIIGGLERCWFLGIFAFVCAWLLYGPFISSNRPLVFEFITPLAKDEIFTPAGREGVHPAGHESRLRLLRFCLLLLHCSAQLRLEEDTWHSSGVCPMQHHFVLITCILSDVASCVSNFDGRNSAIIGSYRHCSC